MSEVDVHHARDLVSEPNEKRDESKKMSELKNGDSCYVSDASAGKALAEERARRFVGLHSNGNSICESNINDGLDLIRWKYAIPIPEKKVIPYTFETFPRGVVYVEYLDDGEKLDYLVCSVTGTGIRIYNSHHLFSELAASWQMSTDFCKSWKPCSQEVEL